MTDAKAGASVRLMGVCLDCADAKELADFYGRLLGWEITAGADDWFNMRDPAGGVGLNFQAEEWYEPPVWPERPGAPAKMLHFEIQVDDMEAAVAHAVAAGARIASPQPEDRDPDQLRIMLDPAGHPFCLCTD
jgi:catechol 2,3-dioxygenase-like lactoylglutathione lyase family enzyme